MFPVVFKWCVFRNDRNSATDIFFSMGSLKDLRNSIGVSLPLPFEVLRFLRFGPARSVDFARTRDRARRCDFLSLGWTRPKGRRGLLPCRCAEPPKNPPLEPEFFLAWEARTGDEHARRSVLRRGGGGEPLRWAPWCCCAGVGRDGTSDDARRWGVAGSMYERRMSAVTLLWNPVRVLCVVGATAAEARGGSTEEPIPVGHRCVARADARAGTGRRSVAVGLGEEEEAHEAAALAELDDLEGIGATIRLRFEGVGLGSGSESISASASASSLHLSSRARISKLSSSFFTIWH